MLRKNTSVLFWALLLPVALVVPRAHGQTVPSTTFRSQAGEPAPYVSSACSPGVPRPNSPGTASALSCEAKLVSGARSIKAIAVEWDAYDANGKLVFHSTQLQDYDFPLPGTHEPQPGETLSVGGHAPPFATKVVCWTVFAEYSDGKIWGNTRSPALLELRASRNGARQVIMFLKQAKESLGAAKALEELGIN